MSIKKFPDNVTAYGLTCPHCKHYTHSYFETVEITNLRRLVQKNLATYQKDKTQKSLELYQSARRTLNVAHSATQEKYAHLMGKFNG